MFLAGVQGEEAWREQSGEPGPGAWKQLSILPLLLIILPKSPNGFWALKLSFAINPLSVFWRV